MDIKETDKPSFKEVHMVDLRNVEHVQVQISADRTKIWINTEYGCILRAYEVKEISVVDESLVKDESPKVLFGGKKDGA